MKEPVMYNLADHNNVDTLLNNFILNSLIVVLASAFVITVVLAALIWYSRTRAFASIDKLEADYKAKQVKMKQARRT